MAELADPWTMSPVHTSWHAENYTAAENLNINKNLIYRLKTCKADPPAENTFVLFGWSILAFVDFCVSGSSQTSIQEIIRTELNLNFCPQNKISLLDLLFSQDLEANEYTQDRYSTAEKVTGTMGLMQTLFSGQVFLSCRTE